MFKYSLDNKRYHTLNYYFKNKFNSKVFKVSLNAGFTCPNIDVAPKDMEDVYIVQKQDQESMEAILIKI